MRFTKKGLNIPEAVNRKRTDKSMAKGIRSNVQTEKKENDKRKVILETRRAH